MPAFTFGEASDVCRSCRQIEKQQQTQAAGVRPKFAVTNVFIGVNVLVLLGMALAAGSNFEQVMVSPSVRDLLRWGADYGPLTLGGQPWRVFTSMWLHIGVVHLLFNMWCLRDYGRVVEHLYGRPKYLVSYVIAGIAASCASLIVHPTGVSAGASGAIFGVVGMLVAPFRRGQLSLDAENLKKARKSLVTFIGYNLLIGFIVPMIDNAAHIGGLVTGVALGYGLSRRPSAQDRASAASS